MITFGELLDLVDADRESTEKVALVNNNGEMSMVGMTNSPYWNALEHRKVNNIGASSDGILLVWLED